MNNHNFEWKRVKQYLQSLQEITIEENNKNFVVRSECVGTYGKVFQVVGVAIPSSIREQKSYLKNYKCGAKEIDTNAISIQIKMLRFCDVKVELN